MSQARSGRNGRRSGGSGLLIGALILGSIGGLVYFNLKRQSPPETFATVRVGRGVLIDKLAETGRIELVRTVEVKSTVSGEILRLAVEAGDQVEKGQLMAVIEPDPNQSLQLYQKRSAVDQARLDLREQEKDFFRRKTLFGRGMLSAKDFEEAQTRLVRARNSLRLAELELEILETKANLSHAERKADLLKLDEVRVLAPIRGIVIRRGVEIGEVVASGLSAFSGGTLLFEIGDPSQMVVRGDIAEIDIGKLRVGQAVEIVVDAYPDTPYRGRVRWIAPVGRKKQGDPIVTFDTEIDILDCGPRLRQGMSCDIDIVFSRRDNALFLPAEAVLEVFDPAGEKEGRRFVAYAVRTAAPFPENAAAADSARIPGASPFGPLSPASSEATEGRSGKPPEASLDEFVEVELEIGLETSTRVEILSGLEEGERVAEDPRRIRREKEEQARKKGGSGS